MRTRTQVIYLIYIDGQVADVTTDLVGAGLRVNRYVRETHSACQGTVHWKVQAMLANSQPGSDNMLASVEGVGRRCTLENVHEMEEMLDTLDKAGALQGAWGSRQVIQS